MPLAANCLSVTPGDRYRLTRQRWAGSLLEDCWLDAPAAVLSVAPNTRPGRRGGWIPGTRGDRRPRDPVRRRPRGPRHEPRGTGARRRSRSADAKVVVGGGRGVGSSEGFADLEELAGLLGGAVGGSRVVTSAGWRPHADQIGQTGLRIAPDLYIACGISGAIQHIVGCKAAKHILAINTDAESPIMGVADYAVIGDLHAVVPAISAEIRRRATTHT